MHCIRHELGLASQRTVAPLVPEFVLVKTGLYGVLVTLGLCGLFITLTLGLCGLFITPTLDLHITFCLAESLLLPVLRIELQLFLSLLG